MATLTKGMWARCAVTVTILFLMAIPATTAEVSLVPIAYHPYPDDADPLGFAAFEMGGRSWDRFMGGYAFLDQERDGFDFPSLVVDGHRLVEGTGGGTYESTLQAYRDAYDARRHLESPIRMDVTVTGDGNARDVQVDLIGAAALRTEPGLLLHWAITEDDVEYRPPPALSNGVFIHRFTARDADPWPAERVRFDEETWTGSFRLELDPEWNMDLLTVAVWVQNHAEDSPGFHFGEVLQATLAPLDQAGTTTQERRAVLLEMYTATWCPVCLFGDSALDTLARENGMASEAYEEPTNRYLRTPDWASFGGGSLAGLLAGAAVVFRRRT